MKHSLFTKVLGLTMASVLAVGMLAGCGGSSSKESEKPAEAAAAASASASAETETVEDIAWPEKPIELILPVNAGGDTDVNGRIFAKYLTDELGQPVTIVNMGGAGGSIGTQEVIDSEPDGYRALWYHNSTILNNITGTSEINYTDLAVANVPLLDKTAILVARADSGWKDFDDMIEYAKANPGKITVGMETATLAHLVPLTIEDAMGVDFNIVDIGAAAARLAGLLGGQIDMYFVQYGAVKDYLATGEFVALCALSDDRNPAYEDIPTAKEFGCDVSFDKFFYFAFPQGTPQEIVDKFNAAVENVIANPDLQAEFNELYLAPEYYDTDAALEIMKETQDFYMKYQDLLK